MTRQMVSQTGHMFKPGDTLPGAPAQAIRVCSEGSTDKEAQEVYRGTYHWATEGGGGRRKDH